MRLPQIQEAKRLLVIESQVGTYFKVVDTESNGEFRVKTFYNKHRTQDGSFICYFIEDYIL